MTTVRIVAPGAVGGVSFAAGDSASEDAGKRALVGVAVPLGVPSEVAADGYRYQFTQPPANLTAEVDAVDEHWSDVVVGRAGFAHDTDNNVIQGRARIFTTTRGNDLLVEYREGVKTGFSVLAAFDAFDEQDGIRHVTGDWTIEHLGVVRAPAFTQAQGLTLAASRGKDGTMPDTTTPPAEPATNAAPTVVELPTVEELAQRVAQFQAEQGQQTRHPLARFASFRDYVQEFRRADPEQQEQLAAAFTLVDQVTTNNPGVIPPGWRNEVKANLDRRRPAIELSGGSIPLPDAGMDANWPYFDGDLDALITRQLTEKAELNSVRVDIKKGTAPIKTAGVASDLSYQLIMRSSPSYLTAYETICFAAWARYTEAQFELALSAAATAGPTLAADLTVAGALATFKGQVFEASAAVEDATGSPATYVGVSPAVWLELGGSPDRRSDTTSNNNADATGNSRNLTLDVDGLPVRRFPFLTSRQVIVSNGDAARFAEQGPMLATEEAVGKLGRDVAVWGMYEDGEVYFPAGIVKLEPAG